MGGGIVLGEGEAKDCSLLEPGTAAVRHCLLGSAYMPLVHLHASTRCHAFYLTGKFLNPQICPHTTRLCLPP